VLDRLTGGQLVVNLGHGKLLKRPCAGDLARVQAALRSLLFDVTTMP
jgi:hypothetical protein